MSDLNNCKSTRTGYQFTPADILLLILINAFWAFSSVAAKVALGSVGPYTLTFLRFMPAGILLLMFNQKDIRSHPIAAEDRLTLFLLGFIGVTLTYVIYFTGLRQTTATDASLLFACEPILLSLFATLFLKEKLTPLQWLGLWLGLFGIWLIAGKASGNWLALLGLSCECFTGVSAKKLVNKYPPFVILSYQMMLGALMALPGSLIELRHPHPIAATALLSIIYLSMFCSVFCYAVWYKLMQRAPLSRMSAFILIQPMLGPVYGYFLMHDIITAGTIPGCVLVVFAIILTNNYVR